MNYRVICFLLLSAATPIGWIARNYTVHGLAQLSPVSTHNLIYFVGAGAIQFREGVDRYEAQARIADRYAIPEYSMAQTPSRHATLSVLEIERQLQEKKWQIVFDDPKSLLGAERIGLAKGSISHAAEDICFLIGQRWNPPGLFRLLQGDPAAFQSLAMNHPIAVAAFFLHLVNIVFLYLGALFAGYIFCRNFPTSTVFLNIASILTCGYLTIALFGMDAVHRSRIGVLPVLCMLSGVGFSWILFRYEPGKVNRGFAFS